MAASNTCLDWLLDPADPGVRYLALRDLLRLPPDDPQLAEARKTAHREGPIAIILDAMDEAGFWVKAGPGYNPKYRATVWSLILLAQLGARADEDGRIQKACHAYLDNALTPNGQFTISGSPSGTVDCLQGNMCWALLELGYSDPRLESAFEWMARSVTGEGVAPLEEKLAPLRYYAGKCGPNFACGANNKLPCAWGAVKVMLAFGRLPVEHRTPLIEKAIQMGVDFLFSVDPATCAYPSGYSDKPSQNWWKFGFPIFYITDLLQIAETLVGLGFGKDPRLANALALINGKQDKLSRWALEYDYTGKTWLEFGEKKQPNKWVTLRALKVL
ncbi:MAG: nitrogen fixation protein NifH [Chloroflexi bacterium]|nr:nitrogen fixation protein NifH [Chloroflexota bacterium]